MKMLMAGGCMHAQPWQCGCLGYVHPCYPTTFSRERALPAGPLAPA